MNITKSLLLKANEWIVCNDLLDTVFLIGCDLTKRLENIF